MTLEQIIRKRRGTAGSNGAWKVETVDPGSPRRIYALWHYRTIMLIWEDHLDRDGNYCVSDALTYSTGNGSVSDQGGMNTAFRVLGLPYYFSRKGGAEIRECAA